MRMTPYILFDGNCAQAFHFYQRCLGGEIVHMQTHGDSPMAGKVPAEWHPRIIHARLVVGDTVLMGSDTPPEHFHPPQGACVALQLEDADEAERIFRALEDGGSVQMRFEETFWAERFGMLVDRFGTPWMITGGKAV